MMLDQITSQNSPSAPYSALFFGLSLCSQIHKLKYAQFLVETTVPTYLTFFSVLRFFMNSFLFLVRRSGLRYYTHTLMARSKVT